MISPLQLQLFFGLSLPLRSGIKFHKPLIKLCTCLLPPWSSLFQAHQVFFSFNMPSFLSSRPLLTLTLFHLWDYMKGSSLPIPTSQYLALSFSIFTFLLKQYLFQKVFPGSQDKASSITYSHKALYTSASKSSVHL